MISNAYRLNEKFLFDLSFSRNLLKTKDVNHADGVKVSIRV